MGLFSRKPQIDPAELLAMRHEFFVLRQRLDASERSKADLEVQVQRLDAAAAAMAARSDVIDDVAVRLADVEVLKRQVAHIEAVNVKIHWLEGVNDRLAELSDRVNATADDAKQATEHVAALHQRVSNVSTELANQLDELSHEIDGLTPNQPSESQPIVVEQPMPVEVLDQLRTAQVRLANEQARYEIAFRQDLAKVADQLKRSRSER